MPSRIGQLRRKVAVGEYELTAHAKTEMEDDGLGIEDVKSAIYGGRIVATQHHGRGVRKYVVEGTGIDGRPLRLVCRLTELRRLRVVTVFAV